MGHPMYLPQFSFIGETQRLSKHIALSASPKQETVTLLQASGTNELLPPSTVSPTPSFLHQWNNLQLLCHWERQASLYQPACAPTAPYWSHGIEASLSPLPWQRNDEEHHPSRGCSPCRVASCDRKDPDNLTSLSKSLCWLCYRLESWPQQLVDLS